MRKSKLFVLLSLSALLVLGLSGFVLATASSEKIFVPDFALTTADNETIRLSDYRGQVVVLNFWASWCPPCRAEMPEFQKLHNELAESQDAVLLLLNQIDGRTETVTSGTKYLADNNFTMTNLFDYGTVGTQMFGIPGLPTTVVIDAEGYLSSYVVGATDKETVWKMIEGAK
ncbi:MAG: TlpA family protein disulfide reductase [Firmicutes bacterium]|nr:TlpA family protein disulfide reductase [Bacillota bacterium]